MSSSVLVEDRRGHAPTAILGAFGAFQVRRAGIARRGQREDSRGAHYDDDHYARLPGNKLLKAKCRRSRGRHAGVEFHVKLTYDPRWAPEMMSSEAKATLAEPIEASGETWGAGSQHQAWF